jgi:sugar/nucleoside kinase (ribokinase family)
MTSLGLKTVSTVGAGDTFIGTFAAFKIRGFGDIESLFLANIAAALKTTKEETRGSPSYAEIKRYADHEGMRLLLKNIQLV